MRALIGAVVGLVVATLVVAFLGSALGQKAFLATIAAGLGAGLLMRSLAAGGGSIYAKGGLAALVTAAAAVAGPLAAEQWFRMQSKAIPAPPTSTKVVSDETANEGDGVAAAEVPVQEAFSPTDGSTGPRFSATRGAGDTQGLEIGSMVIGCLLAYQLGKGSAPKSSAEGEGEPVVDGEAPVTTDDSAEPEAQA